MFRPKRAFFEPQALEYPLGKRLYEELSKQGVPIRLTPSHNRVVGIPGETPQQAYREAKKTLVIGVRRTSKFPSCRPSAHYQLPLVTSCPGMCEYCYLATTLGNKPYVRVYVNLDQILEWAAQHMERRNPWETLFEGAATSDPVPVEPYTGALAKTITFFGRSRLGKFRFATKFDDIDSLLDLDHKRRTEIRFSINAASIIKNFEHGTPSLKRRLAAAHKVQQAGYPIGFLVAPIMDFPNWREEYGEMFRQLKQNLEPSRPVTFEFITHRFTPQSKTRILNIFPETGLDMDESRRKFRFGQFGYGKYLYPSETIKQFKDFFTAQTRKFSKHSSVLYTV